MGLTLTPGSPHRLAGSLRAQDGEALHHALRELEPSADLDMSELELEDGPSVAYATSAVEQLWRRWGRLTLIGAPQHLAHTLYKVGRLRQDGLVLIDPRKDEHEEAG